jgi:transcriptional regulator with XRE-family HTH domain
LKSSRAIAGLPPTIARVLRKLGHDLSVARRRRRLTMALVAERAFISRLTLARVERGDPGVSLGIYATVLFVFGMADRIGELADPTKDPVGVGLDEEHLPRRVRSPRPRTGAARRGS